MQDDFEVTEQNIITKVRVVFSEHGITRLELSHYGETKLVHVKTSDLIASTGCGWGGMAYDGTNLRVFDASEDADWDYTLIPFTAVVG